MAKHDVIIPGLLDALTQHVAAHVDACHRALSASADAHDTVHEIRRRLKVIRAVLRLLRDHLGSARFREYNKYYRDIGRMLRRYRDAQSLVETTDTLGKHYDALIQTRVIASLKDGFTAARDQMSMDVIDGTLSAVRDRLTAQPLTDGHGRDLTRKDFVRSIARVYRRGQREYRQTRKRRSDDVMHEWRKRAKYLRYIFEVLADPGPSTFTETADSLHDLTDALGDHHNLELLRINLSAKENAELRETAGLDALMRVQQKHLWKKSLRMGKALYAIKPRFFAEGIADIYLQRRVIQPRMT